MAGSYGKGARDTVSWGTWKQINECNQKRDQKYNQTYSLSAEKSKCYEDAPGRQPKSVVAPIRLLALVAASPTFAKALGYSAV